MESFSFVHAADLHIDSPFKGVTAHSPHIAAQLQEATARAFQNIVDLCIDNRVDFLVVAGDIYDSSDRQIQSQLAFLDGIKRLAQHNIQSFIVHGNHDPLKGWAKSLDFEAAQATVFPVRPTAAIATKDGRAIASLVGMSYAEAKEDRNVVGEYKRLVQDLHPDLFKIGVLHSNVGNIAGHANYAPCSLDDLKSAGYDYWALGHVHERKQLWPSPIIAYPGNSQGRHIRERGARGALLVSVDGRRSVTSKFVATDCIRWEEASIEISPLQTIDALDGAIEKSLIKLRSQADGRALVCRIELTGRGPLYEKLKSDQARKELVTRFREKFSREKPFIWLEQLDFNCSPNINWDVARNREDLLAFVLSEADRIREQDITIEFAPDLKPLFEHKWAADAIPTLSKEELEACLRAAEVYCADLLEGQ